MRHLKALRFGRLLIAWMPERVTLTSLRNAIEHIAFLEKQIRELKRIEKYAFERIDEEKFEKETWRRRANEYRNELAQIRSNSIDTILSEEYQAVHKPGEVIR